MLFTDLYQLTLAQAYLRHGLHELPAQFDVFFRRLPDYGAHQTMSAVAAGADDTIVSACGHRTETKCR